MIEEHKSRPIKGTRIGITHACKITAPKCVGFLIASHFCDLDSTQSAQLGIVKIVSQNYKRILCSEINQISLAWEPIWRKWKPSWICNTVIPLFYKPYQEIKIFKSKEEEEEKENKNWSVFIWAECFSFYFRVVISCVRNSRMINEPHLRPDWHNFCSSASLFSVALERAFFSRPSRASEREEKGNPQREREPGKYESWKVTMLYLGLYIEINEFTWCHLPRLVVATFGDVCFYEKGKTARLPTRPTIFSSCAFQVEFSSTLFCPLLSVTHWQTIFVSPIFQTQPYLRSKRRYF